MTLTSTHNVFEAAAPPLPSGLTSNTADPMSPLRLAPPASLISQQCQPPSSGTSMRRGSRDGGDNRGNVHGWIRAAWRLRFSEASIAGVTIGYYEARWLFSSEPAAKEEFGLACLLLFLFPRRSNGSASAHATINVLLFLLCRFQNLQRKDNRGKLHVHVPDGVYAFRRMV